MGDVMDSTLMHINKGNAQRTQRERQNKVALRQVLRKQVSFQVRKKANTPKSPCIEI